VGIFEAGSEAIDPLGGLMLASNGNTRERSISTPAMGHDSAWRKAAMVTIIAAKLPRSSGGLDDISSTTGIVEKSILLAQNGIVTVRAQEESYPAVLRTTPFRGRRTLPKQAYEGPHLTVLRTPILIWCNFFPKHFFHRDPLGGRFSRAPPSTGHHIPPLTSKPEL